MEIADYMLACKASAAAQHNMWAWTTGFVFVQRKITQKKKLTLGEIKKTSKKETL